MSGYSDLAGIVEFRPLSETLPSHDLRSPFSASWSSTVRLLATEIQNLEPERAILEVDLPDHAIRRDGLPRADARASSGAVILTLLGTQKGLSAQARRGKALIRRHGTIADAQKATHPDHGGDQEDFLAVMAAVNAPQMRYRCARFRSWQENVRAIALGMEALRKVERYAITEADQQYAGFMALPRGA